MKVLTQHEGPPVQIQGLHAEVSFVDELKLRWATAAGDQMYWAKEWTRLAANHKHVSEHRRAVEKLLLLEGVGQDEINELRKSANS